VRGTDDEGSATYRWYESRSIDDAENTHEKEEEQEEAARMEEKDERRTIKKKRSLKQRLLLGCCCWLFMNNKHQLCARDRRRPLPRRTAPFLPSL